jgi:glycosyltransferase involved in cell wall biosynthesis
MKEDLMTSKYVLLTAARNEAEFIGQTIASVLRQSVLPQRWIIVDDGSTDMTAAIVRHYAKAHDFIQLIHCEGDVQRNFGSKSKAITYAYAQVVDVDFDYVGNLDADITHIPDYYASIMKKFELDPKLGLAGGIRYDIVNGEHILVDCARNSVGGPIQMFRRECWERIGGYMPLPYGGVDAVAETSARMHGWKVQSFPEYHVFHHRPTGTANRSIWNALYRAGIRDYTIGYHPMFELSRCFRHIKKHPYVVGSLITIFGYMRAWLLGIKRPVSNELVEFLQAEQMNRLKSVVSRRIPASA